MFGGGGEVKPEGASLPEVERQFPRLVELAPDAVFLHGLDGRLRYVNDAACTVLGYSRDELLSMCPWDFVVNDSRDDILALWRGMAPGVPVMVEGLFRRKDGTTLPAEVRLSRFEDAGRDWIAASRFLCSRAGSDRNCLSASSVTVILKGMAPARGCPLASVNAASVSAAC